MAPLPRFIPDDVRIGFMARRHLAMAFSGALVLLSLVLVFTVGLNFGIDFRGGSLIELRMPGPADLAAMRKVLSELDLGQVELQNFGDEREVLIRIERQEGNEEAQRAAVEKVKQALVQAFGEGVEFRRAEYVGPKVSRELFWDGVFAVGLALALVLVYIWFRFEWHFGAGAIIALFHDVITTLGVFVVTGYEFNLSTVAAILTIVGYSLNDTVIIYDRIRENMRRYKTMPLDELIDRSISETLARTTMTSFTTLLALVVLYVVGPSVISGFTFAMIWGVIVGTYSSIYIAAPILIHLGLRREAVAAPAAATGS
ncbi:hypothetical protein HRbin39_00573 [bacterium HR39]|nr:hypothetical protein HRbin39_00573 [bacterium HR39]